MNKFSLMCLFLILTCQSAIAVHSIGQTHWTQLDQNQQFNQKRTEQTLALDVATIEALLATSDFVDMALPLPSGQFVRYRLKPSQVMAPELARKYPQIMTFRGAEIGQPDNLGSFDLSSKGFFGMFEHGGKTVYIDPVKGTELYRSYYFTHAMKQASPVKIKRHPPIRFPELSDATGKRPDDQLQTSQISERIVYRLAVAATGEYTAYHGGTRELALAALVTMVNRVNQVYARDLGVTFQLVANNDQLIFLDAATDPFTNSDQDINGDIIADAIEAVIGVSDYDIGHLVVTEGGGVAGLGVVCTSEKASGLTGSSVPESDAFYIDYVAHEIGHQLGAEHTFNGLVGACQGNRSGLSAFEPASGSTIMGYTGICGTQDLQRNSDPFFHLHSIEQMVAFTRQGVGSTCGNRIGLTNQSPVVDAGSDYFIPARTPFTLTGSATDPDSDTLTFSWQQFDLGTATSSPDQDAIDRGAGPLFRVFDPTSEPVRTFPRLIDILTNSSVLGETYPTTNRILNFRLAVRDGQGHVASDAMQVSVVNSTNGFAVTQPDGSSQWESAVHSISWDTANTQNAPVSCSRVSISLSTDGGMSFPTPLANAVDNDGQQDVLITSAISTNQARVRVNCSDNIFFAINSGNFTINFDGPAEPIIPVYQSQDSLSVNEDERLTVKVEDLTFAFDLAIDSITLMAGDNYTLDGTTVIPDENFNGQLVVPATATKGNQSSEQFSIEITVVEVNDVPMVVNDKVEVAFQANLVVLPVLSNDTDVDGDTLNISSVDYQGEGTVTIASTNLVYTAGNAFSGAETFSYTVSDGNGGSASGEVEVTVAPAPASVPVEPDPEPNLPPEPPAQSLDDGSSGGTLFAVLWILIICCGTRLGVKKYGM
ncbi:reprolysin-like metallopeptidase [Pseudoalteromonas rubra]|nr:zinc-dependent metalloprotease family protein [Pseudoalteromonas rubra]